MFLQVLSPRPFPADDAVLCSCRFESSAHYSGCFEAGHSGRRRLRGARTATGQYTEPSHKPSTIIDCYCGHLISWLTDSQFQFSMFVANRVL